MGIEPTHKGFADLLLGFLTSYPSIDAELVIEVFVRFLSARHEQFVHCQKGTPMRRPHSLLGLKIENLGYPVSAVSARRCPDRSK